MASLVDKVNKTLVRKDGKLVEQVTPTSQLAGQAGLTAPPMTPAGVGALGGTPQQQAMAGSVAQKQSALRQSLDTVTTLGEAEADKRYRSAASAEEQKKLDQQKRLGEVFGSTQQKVQDLIGAEMNKQVAPATRLETAGALTTTDQSKQADIDATFSQIVSGVNTQANIVKLMELTGQTQEQIAAAAQDAASKQIQSGTGKAAASATADASAVNVGALLPSLGTTREELASLLGLSPEQVDTMSLADVDEAVKATTTQGPLMGVAETTAAAQDATLGSAERAALREQSIEQSTTGQAASEAQLASLGHALESAEVVQFGGKQYTVEQLLSDENISKLVSDYLTNPDSETSKQLAADPNAKGLLDFVGKYKQALTDAATSVGTATAANKQIQETNKALSSPVPGVNIPDSVMKAIYGDKWGTAQATTLSPTSGLVGSLKELGTAGVAKISDGLNQMFSLAQTDADFAKEISSFNSTTLSKFLTPDASGTTPMKRMLDARTLQKQVTADRNSGNVDDLLSLYFGQPMQQNAAVRKELGLTASEIYNAGGGKDSASYTKGLVKLLGEKIGEKLNSADSPGEVSEGAKGWAPISLTDKIAAAKAAEEKAAKTAKLKQEAVTKRAAITKYVNEYKPALTAERKAEIINNEMSWYVKNGYA